MALNMFSIEETKLRSGSSSATTPTTYRSVAQVPVITIFEFAKFQSDGRRPILGLLSLIAKTLVPKDLNRQVPLRIFANQTTHLL